MVHTRRSKSAEVTEEPPPLRVVYVSYADTLAGHEEMGRTIGQEMRAQIADAVATDPEVKLLLRVVALPGGKALYEQYLRVVEEAYPMVLYRAS